MSPSTTSTIAGHELIGSRETAAAPVLVGQLAVADVARVWTRITSAIVKQGFVLEYRDLEPPRTGIFDGLRIAVDPDVDFEMQCFILLHLFGHSVQWVAPAIEHELDDLRHTTDKERFLAVLRDYEFKAAQFGLQLLHQTGIRDLNQWYSDFVETDWRYVDHFYRHQQIPAWNTCIAHGTAVISPAAIPELRHRQVEVRFAF